MGKRIVIAVAGALLAIYVAASPCITVWQLQSAAEHHDAEALSACIDFPSVRQSIKDQMNAMFMKELARDRELQDNPFASTLGAALAGIVVDKMVDAYVTSSGITMLMSGEKPASADGSEGSGSSGRKPLSEATMSYASLDRFVVKVNAGTNDERQFVLHRRGLGWKLAEIVIPRM